MVIEHFVQVATLEQHHLMGGLDRRQTVLTEQVRFLIRISIISLVDALRWWLITPILGGI
jgi:hypothetical protein